MTRTTRFDNGWYHLELIPLGKAREIPETVAISHGGQFVFHRGGFETMTKTDRDMVLTGFAALWKVRKRE